MKKLICLALLLACCNSQNESITGPAPIVPAQKKITPFFSGNHYYIRENDSLFKPQAEIYNPFTQISMILYKCKSCSSCGGQVYVDSTLPVDRSRILPDTAKIDSCHSYYIDTVNFCYNNPDLCFN